MFLVFLMGAAQTPNFIPMTQKVLTCIVHPNILSACGSRPCGVNCDSFG